MASGWPGKGHGALLKRSPEGTPWRSPALPQIPGPAPAPSAPRRRDEPLLCSRRQHGPRRRAEIPRLADRERRPPLGVGEALAKEAVQPPHQRVAEPSTLLSLSYSRGGEGDRPATEDQSTLGPEEVL